MTSSSAPRLRRRVMITIAAAGCGVALALMLAACGGSGSGAGGGAVGATTATGDASPAALSQCMRAHGLSNFPDPTMGPGGEGLSVNIGAPGTLTVDGTTFSGPALAAAEKGCKQYLIPKGPPPQPTAAQRRAALALAACMRRNGVPNFPDPIGPGNDKQGPSQAVQASPAFQHASEVCGGAKRKV